jgi:hypothetical protein
MIQKYECGRIGSQSEICDHRIAKSDGLLQLSGIQAIEQLAKKPSAFLERVKPASFSKSPSTRPI